MPIDRYKLEIIADIGKADQEIDKLFHLLKLFDEKIVVDIASSDIKTATLLIEDLVRKFGLSGTAAKTVRDALISVTKEYQNLGSSENSNRLVRIFQEPFQAVRSLRQEALQLANAMKLSPDSLRSLSELDNASNRAKQNIAALEGEYRKFQATGDQRGAERTLAAMAAEANRLSEIVNSLSRSLKFEGANDQLTKLSSLLAKGAGGRNLVKDLNETMPQLESRVGALQNRLNELKLKGFSSGQDVREFRAIEKELELIDRLYKQIGENIALHGIGKKDGFRIAGVSREDISRAETYFNTLTQGAAKANTTATTLNGTLELQKRNILSAASAEGRDVNEGAVNKRIQAQTLLRQQIELTKRAINEEENARRNLAKAGLGEDQLIEEGKRLQKSIDANRGRLEKLQSNLAGVSAGFVQLKQRINQFILTTQSGTASIDQIEKEFKDLFGVQLQGATAQERLSNATRKAREEYQLLGRAAAGYGSSIKSAASLNRNAERSFDRMHESLKDFNAFMTIAIEKIIRYRIAFVAMQQAMTGLRQTLDVPVQIQSAFVQLEKVLDERTADLETLRTEAFALSRTFGVAVTEIIDIMYIWGQQGKQTSEILELTRTTVIGMKAANLDAKEAVEVMTSAMRIYNLAAEDSIIVFDKLLNVQKAFAVETKDLAQALKLLGTTAEEFGVDMDSLFGSITAIVQVTRKSGQQVANALKTIFARFIQTDTVEALREINIAVFNTDGSVRNLDDTLEDLVVRWETLTDAQRLNIARLVGGVRHYNQFLILMDQYRVKVAAAEIAQSSMGFTVAAASKELATIGNQIERVRAFFVELAQVIGSSEFGFASMVDSLLNVVEGLSHLTQSGSATLKLVGNLTGFFLSFAAAASVAKIAQVGFGIANAQSAKILGNQVLNGLKAVASSHEETQRIITETGNVSVKSALYLAGATEEQINAAKIQLVLEKNREQSILKVGTSTITVTRAVQENTAAVNANSGAWLRNNVATKAALLGWNGLKTAAKSTAVAIKGLYTALGGLPGILLITAFELGARFIPKLFESKNALDEFKASMVNATEASSKTAAAMETLAKKNILLTTRVLALDKAISNSASVESRIVALRELESIQDDLLRSGLVDTSLINGADLADAQVRMTIIQQLTKSTAESIRDSGEATRSANRELNTTIEELERRNKLYLETKDAIDDTRDILGRISKLSKDNTGLNEALNISKKIQIEEAKRLALIQKINTLISLGATQKEDDDTTGVQQAERELDNIERKLANLKANSNVPIEDFENLRTSLLNTIPVLTRLENEIGTEDFKNLGVSVSDVDKAMEQLEKVFKKAKEAGKDFVPLAELETSIDFMKTLNTVLEQANTKFLEGSDNIEKFNNLLLRGLNKNQKSLSLTTEELNKINKEFAQSAASAQVFANSLTRHVAGAIQDALSSGQTASLIDENLKAIQTGLKKARDIELDAEKDLEEAKKRRILLGLIDRKDRAKNLALLIEEDSKIEDLRSKLQPQLTSFDDKTTIVQPGSIMDPDTIAAAQLQLRAFEQSAKELTQKILPELTDEQFATNFAEFERAMKGLLPTTEETIQLFNELQNSVLSDADTEIAGRERLVALAKEFNAPLVTRFKLEEQYFQEKKRQLTVQEKELDLLKEGLKLRVGIAQSITAGAGKGQQEIADIIEASNNKLAFQEDMASQIGAQFLAISDDTKLIGNIQKGIVSGTLTWQDAMNTLLILSKAEGTVYEESAQQLERILKLDQEIFNVRQENARLQGEVLRNTEKVRAKLDEARDILGLTFELEKRITEQLFGETTLINIQTKQRELRRKAEEASYNVIIDAMRQQIALGRDQDGTLEQSVVRLTEIRDLQSENVEEVDALRLKYEKIAPIIERASERAKELASVIAESFGTFNSVLFKRFEDIHKVEQNIAEQESKISDLRRQQSSLVGDTTDEYSRLTDEIAKAQFELNRMKTDAESLQRIGSMITDTFQDFGQKLGDLVINIQTRQLEESLVEIFKGRGVSNSIVAAFLTGSERASVQLGLAIRGRIQEITKNIESVFDNVNAGIADNITSASEYGSSLYRSAIIDASTEAARILGRTTGEIGDVKPLASAEEKATLKSSEGVLAATVGLAIIQENGFGRLHSAIISEQNVLSAALTEIQKGNIENARDIVGETGDVGSGIKGLSNKQQALASAFNLFSSNLGSALGLQAGGSTAGVQAGVGFGSAIAPLIGLGAGASTTLLALLPGIGGIIGGLLGGLTSSRDTEVDPIFPEKPKIEENTQALVEATTAIRVLSTEFVDLRNELINAPARFVLPAQVGSASFVGPGGGTGNSQASPGVSPGLTVQFNINGGFDSGVADQTVQRINEIYQSQARTNTTFARRFR